MDKVVEACLVCVTVIGVCEGTLRCVVEEVGNSNDFVSRVPDDGRFNAVEGEEVGDLPILVLLRCQYVATRFI